MEGGTYIFVLFGQNSRMVCHILLPTHVVVFLISMGLKLKRLKFKLNLKILFLNLPRGDIAVVFCVHLNDKFILH